MQKHADEPIYTTSGAARRIGVSEATIRRLATIGELPVTKTETGARLFRQSDLDAYAKRKAITK
jgi:excisionase family DNA binding protein